MIPLHDDNPTHRPSYITWSIIAVCVLVYLWQFSAAPASGQRIVFALGVIPGTLFGDVRLHPDIALLPPVLTIFTSMFLHGGWMHLLGNMLYLWIFGNNVEEAMGHGKFILFYLICGVVAFLAHAAGDPGSRIPLVGASGALSGVLGAYLLLYPRARVLVLIPLFIIFWTFRLPAVVVLGGWILLQFINAGAAGDSNVAWWAHIGGFMAGMALIPFFKHRHVPLFAPARGAAGGMAGPRPAAPSASTSTSSGADRPSRPSRRRYRTSPTRETPHPAEPWGPRRGASDPAPPPTFTHVPKVSRRRKK